MTLNMPDEHSRNEWLATLTPAELDALLRATEEDMGPEQARQHYAEHPSAVLTGQRVVDWHFLVAVTRCRH